MKIQRYFIADADSPLHAEIDRLAKAYRKGFRAVRKFMDKHKLSATYGSTPADYRFDPKGDFDSKKWSKVKGRRGEWWLRPKRNTPEGKALMGELKTLPACMPVESAISIIPGLDYRMPMVFSKSTAYYPFLRYFSHQSKLCVVCVPGWEGETPMTACHQAAQAWQPPEWLREVKEGEALKAIDEDSEP